MPSWTYPRTVQFVPGIVDATDEIKRSNANIGNFEAYASSPDESGLFDFQILGMPPPMNHILDDIDHVHALFWSKNSLHGRSDILNVGSQGNGHKTLRCNSCGDVFMEVIQLDRNMDWTVIGSGNCTCSIPKNYPSTLREIVELKYEHPLLGIFTIYNNLYFLSGKVPLGIYSTIGIAPNAEWYTEDTVSWLSVYNVLVNL